MAIGSTHSQARALRRNATEAEVALWQHLRGRRLIGLKFRRQAPIERFIVDFYCPEKRLIVEVDGGQHTAESDQARTGRLEALGYKVIRFWNNDVLGNTLAVLETIKARAEALPSRFTGKEPASNFN